MGFSGFTGNADWEILQILKGRKKDWRIAVLVFHPPAATHYCATFQLGRFFGYVC